VFKVLPATELTEASSYLSHSCSELLLIDVIFICFNDNMLFTRKFGEWHLAQQKIERWRKSVFVYVRMTFSHLLMVTDRTLKLHYTSVIFINYGVHIDKTYFNYLTAFATYHT